MRTLLVLPCAAFVLAAVGCTPPADEMMPPAAPGVTETAHAGGDHDTDDHDHDHDHADGDHDHEHHAPPRSTSEQAAHVKVLETTSLACGATEAVGPVDVHEPMHSEEEALDMLRRRANDLGADAVLGVEFHHGAGGVAPTHLSGLAVRCNDLLQGREYDVIQKLDISGIMGDEEDAFAALKSKAADLGADLILDVEFKHGDGGPGVGTRVTGTAIKLRK
jgi:uncharacterized protein YbjQ (UPF0145 family)